MALILYNFFIDVTSGIVNWAIEDYASPIETNNPAPKPTSGSKYLRAARNSQSEAGRAILRSEIFTGR